MPVVPFRQRSSKSSPPIICFLDLQLEYVAEGRALALEEQMPWIANCRRLLAVAREERMSIAHFRQLWRKALLNPATPFASWIEEFRPRPSEMIFERELPSCYAAKSFVSVLDNIDAPHLILVGLTGHGACLATVLDGFHRKHEITFVKDASWTPRLGTFAPSTVHACIGEIIACYAEVTTTHEIIEWLTGLTWAADAIGGGK